MDLEIVCVGVCLSRIVCVCVFGAGRKDGKLITYVCMHFGRIFKYTCIFKPCRVLHTDRNNCSFTSSWCSFCSGSWSTPGCCLQTALMQKTPEEQRRHQGRTCQYHLKFSCYSSWLYHTLSVCISLTLSFLSQRNFSLWALLCMKTPSRWPVSTERISMAFSPHPMIWFEQIWAARQNIILDLTKLVTFVFIMRAFFIYYYPFLDLTRTNRCGHLAPLQNHVLNDASVGVDVDTFVLIAQQHFHAVWAGQEHNCVWCHMALDLFETITQRMSLFRLCMSQNTAVWQLHNLREQGYRCHSCFRSLRRWHGSQHKNHR